MSYRVLVAEHDETELELIATVLARDGFQVVRATDGAAAVALFEAEPLELVICAAELPELNGAAVCEAVKRAKPETRVVLLHPAGSDIDASAILVSRISCDAVLPSPFRYDSLKVVLADWRMRATPKAAAAAMSFAVPAPDISELVAAPSLEGLVPEAAAPVAPVVAPAAEGETPIAVPIPIPVVFPAVAETPVLAEYTGPRETVEDDVEALVREFVRGPMEEVREPRSDVRDPRSEVRDPTSDIRDPTSEIRDPTSDVGSTAFDVRGSISDVRGPIFARDEAKRSPTAAVIAEWVEGTEAEPGVVEEVERAVAEWTLRESTLDLESAAEPPAGESVAADDSAAQPEAAEPAAAELAPPAPAPIPAARPVAEHPSLDADLERAFPGPAPDFNAEAALRMLELPAEPPEDAPLVAVASDAASERPPEPAEDWLVEPPPRVRAAAVEPAPEPPAGASPSSDAGPDVGEERLVVPPEPTPPPLQPTKVNFGTIPGHEPSPSRQAPPPPPVESIVDPNQPASGVRAGASSWAPTSSDASSSSAPRIEARGLIAPPPAPDDNAVPPPPPSDALADTGAPPPVDDSLADTTQSPPAEEPAPPPPPSEAMQEPAPAPLAAMSPRPFAPKHEPRTTLPPSVPPEGDLRSLPLPRLLFELYSGTYCGTLKLTRKGVERIIDIWNGFPVTASVTPTSDDDSLATLLRDHGRITPDQFADAKRRAPGREAQLLVALGIIDERDLLDVMREQTELRVAASFEWRDGHYKITAAKEPPESALSEVHPIKAIWRGCSEHYDVASLLAFFSTLRARYIVATEVFPIHYPTLGPFLRRVGIADILNGSTTFEQALRSDDTQALAIAQALYVLVVTDMVRAQAHPGAPAVLAENKPKRRQTQPVDYRELSRVCEEVARAYLGVRERDYFEVLEVSRDAGDDEVNQAYERLSKPFKVESLLPGLPEDVMRRAREIDGLLRRARDTLVSPDERRRYLSRLDPEPPPPPIADAVAN